MNTPSDIFRKLLRHLGVAGPARVRAFKGTSAPWRTLTLTPLLALIAFSVSTVPAQAEAEAETPAPGWEVTSNVFPTNLAPSGGKGVIEVNVFNTGAAESTGTVTVTDVLPPGVVATEAGDVQKGDINKLGELGLWECTGNSPDEALPRKIEEFEKPATVVTCVNSPERLPTLPIPEVYGSGAESGSGTVAHIGIAVQTTTGVAQTLSNAVTIAGGGASGPASTVSPVVVSSTPASAFGFQSLDGWFADAEGATDTQAGSHPYDFTASFNLNTLYNHEQNIEILEPVGGESRDLTVNLPPGFIGNPTAIPQCTRQQFDFEECSPSTQVGTDEAGIGTLPSRIVPGRVAFPVYNLVPPPGVPAEFAFDLVGVQIFIEANVRTGGNYGLVVHTNNIGYVKLMYDDVTFWGDPSDPLHNPYRFSKKGDLENGTPQCTQGCSSSAPRIPFLTLPTSCEGAQPYSASLDTWETAGLGEDSFFSHDSSDSRAGFTGCDHLLFAPTIAAAPDTSEADTPAGLTVEVKALQEGLATPGVLTTSDIKKTTVTLPAGVVINPGQAAGLQVCQFSQSGIGVEPTPAEPTRGEPECPNASKVGTDEAQTPILFKALTGNVYVLQSEPPHLKLLAALSGEGVDVKLILNVELNEQTGQITTHLGENAQIEAEYPELKGHLLIPQAPVSDFKLSFSGGAQAALATPTRCGSYQTTSDFTPWSTPDLADVFPSSVFNLGSGSDGAACPSGVLPFTPSLTAGATTDQAGGFTDFSLLLQRPDDQQRIAGLRFKAPAGLTGELARVPLCTNAQAESNTCPEASKIGHTAVEAGPGPYPLVIPEPGQPPAPIYLTESYGGAPFGLSIVVPLQVGPFTLPTQRVRAKIEIDKTTAQLIVTTNELPQEVAGVPTDLREVDAVIERPEFMVNPTNCNPQEFSGTAYGTAPPGQSEPATSAAISSHFQVGACRALEFKPKFSASTSGKTSKSRGASLTATVSYPSVPQGTDADIALTKVELPKQLPSRLTTLQKACTARTFEENPAKCPSESFIGHAVVHTPLLPVPLIGPAIFVSHGGEAFPSLEIVLQGDGVTVDLVGATFISKAGITSTTFKTVPDAPFSSFELTLPEGKFSALAANGNLCGLTKTVTVKKKLKVKVHGHKQTETRNVKTTEPASLALPNEFVGQNGAQIHESTPIKVTGCPKLKTAKKSTKKHKKKQAKKATRATTNRRARS
jgi:hypothetical protein